MTPAHFRGFGPDAVAFFEGLAAENTRDWFHAHKADYERADFAERALPLLRFGWRALEGS